MKHSNKTYVFTPAQIKRDDVSDFISRFDPAKLSAAELAGMCRAVRVRIEEAQAAHDIFADLHCRKFFWKLHAEFPYAGYFFRLHPLRSPKPSPALIDASIFVAMGLCHTDVVEARWDRLDTQVILFRIQQFDRFLAEIDHHTTELGKRDGLTAPAIDHRRKAVAKTVRSFLHLGNLRIISKKP
jgi:hypothetical protein